MGCCLCSVGTHPCVRISNVIIGLIFLRYISTAFEEKYKQLKTEGDGFENDPVAPNGKIGLVLANGALSSQTSGMEDKTVLFSTKSARYDGDEFKPKMVAEDSAPYGKKED